MTGVGGAAAFGPPLRLESLETRTRVGPKRIVIRCEFHFWQAETLVYFGDQTAMFLKDPSLGGDGGARGEAKEPILVARGT